LLKFIVWFGIVGVGVGVGVGLEKLHLKLFDEIPDRNFQLHLTLTANQKHSTQITTTKLLSLYPFTSGFIMFSVLFTRITM